MFCQKCGFKFSDDSKFCPKCGSGIESAQTTTMGMDNDIVDLSNQTDYSLPREGKYKPIFTASFVFSFIWILYAVCGGLFYRFVMEYSSDMVIMGILFVSIPFALLFLPFLLKAKRQAVQTERKVGKKESITLYIMIWLTTSFAIVTGFAGAFSRFGFLNIIAKVYFGVFLIVFIFMCNALSHQSGEEVYFAMHKAAFTGFFVAVPLGWILGKLMGLMELGMVVILVCFIGFFAFGGRVLFIRNE